jgi:hypothetical protein
LGVGRGANNASPSKNHVKKHSQGEMLPLGTKQSRGKLLPQRSLGEECFWRKYHAANKATLIHLLIIHLLKELTIRYSHAFSTNEQFIQMLDASTADVKTQNMLKVKSSIK